MIYVLIILLFIEVIVSLAWVLVESKLDSDEYAFFALDFPEFISADS